MEAQKTQRDEKASSQPSSKGTSSSKCSVASAAAKARAAAEAAHTRVTFEQKELELKKQKAKLDLEKATLEANLEALELEKEAAAANAEAEVLEAAARKECEDMQSVVGSDVSPQSIRQRTEAYLEHQAQVSFKPNTPASDTPPPPHITETQPLTRQEVPESSPAYHHDGSPTTSRQYVSTPLLQTHPPEHPSSHPHSSYKPYQEQPSSPFRHASYSDHSPRYNAQRSAITPSSNMIDFAKYLARR